MGKRILTYIDLAAVLIALIVGGGLLFNDLGQYLEGRASRNWQSAPGKVKLQNIKILNRDGGRIHYSLGAAYVFHVGDSPYRNIRVAYPGDIEVSDPDPKAVFRKFTPESDVLVYFDPKDPNHSTLIQGANWRQFIMAWLRDGLLLAAGIGGAIWLLIEKRKAKATTSETSAQSSS